MCCTCPRPATLAPHAHLYCERPRAHAPARRDSGEEDRSCLPELGGPRNTCPSPLRPSPCSQDWTDPAPPFLPKALWGPAVSREWAGGGESCQLDPRPLVALPRGAGHWRNGRGWTGTCQPPWRSCKAPPPQAPRCPCSGLSLTVATSLLTVGLARSSASPAASPPGSQGRQGVLLNPLYPRGGLSALPTFRKTAPQAPRNRPTPAPRSDVA